MTKQRILVGEVVLCLDTGLGSRRSSRGVGVDGGGEETRMYVPRVIHPRLVMYGGNIEYGLMLRMH